jgi:hypothetical protein
MTLKSRFAAPFVVTVAMLFAASPGLAQQTPSPTPAPQEEKPAQAESQKPAGETGEAANAGMVRVNISAIRDSLATQLNVTTQQIPEFILAPPEVAAEACSVAANTLTADLEPDGDARCVAITTSHALRQVVQKAMAG